MIAVYLIWYKPKLFFRFLKGTATNFGRNWQNDLHWAGWSVDCNMAILVQKYSVAIL